MPVILHFWAPSVGDLQGLKRKPVERRNFVRYALRVPVVFGWNDNFGNRQQGTGFTRDISPGGAVRFLLRPPCRKGRVFHGSAAPSVGQINDRITTLGSWPRGSCGA